jgi:hypothetical protein
MLTGVARPEVAPALAPAAIDLPAAGPVAWRAAFEFVVAVPVAAQVAVVAAAAVAAVMALPLGGRLWWQDLLLMWFLRWPLHARFFYQSFKIVVTSAALVLQAAGVVLSFCSTYWRETLCRTHGQLQKCQMPLKPFHIKKNTSRTHRSAQRTLLLTPGIPFLPTLRCLPARPPDLILNHYSSRLQQNGGSTSPKWSTAGWL